MINLNLNENDMKTIIYVLSNCSSNMVLDKDLRTQNRFRVAKKLSTRIMRKLKWKFTPTKGGGLKIEEDE
jgi:hypothetical protein